MKWIEFEELELSCGQMYNRNDEIRPKAMDLAYRIGGQREEN